MTNWQRIKRTLVGAMLLFTLVIGSGMMLQTRADAGVRAAAPFDWGRDRAKGYHDGLNRGREDFQTRRIYNPNNSEHYRHGNGAYRAGFREGYADGYNRRRR